MSDVEALAQALMFLDGHGGALPSRRKAVPCFSYELARRGYVVRPPNGSALQDRSPANFVATPRALGLRVDDVAREAGVSVNTVYKAEHPTRCTQVSSVEAIAAALDRLAAGKR